MTCIASVATLATGTPRHNALALTLRNERLLNGLKGGYATPEELPQTGAAFIQNHADNASPKEAEKTVAVDTNWG